MYNAIYFLSLSIVPGDPSNSGYDKRPPRRSDLSSSRRRQGPV